MDAPKNDEAFDNRAFWNRRYEDDPGLGSGIGSRGANLAHKLALVADALAGAEPASVLDVGCGDGQLIAALAPTTAYRGLDISPVVIDQNRRRFPGRTFDCVDFAALDDARAYRAEAVLCLEVAIHQHRADDYARLIRNLVAATSRVGLISGYVSDPRPAVRSAIIAWHEPITDTLRRLGAADIRIRGRSLENDALAFVSFRAPATATSE